MGAARHAESTQNNNYAISPQCLKKVVRNGADFLHADKHLNFLQVDTTIFIVFMYLARPVSSTQKNLYLSDISRTKLEMQLIFLHAGKRQSLQYVDTIFFDWCCEPAQNTENNKLAISYK